MTPAPDLLVRGTLHTLDPERPRAEALLARAGRTVRVGDLAGCRAEARAGYRELDLGAGSAVPGLADAHGHVLWHARNLETVDLRGAESARACVERVAHAARAAEPEAWLRGQGWDDARWPDVPSAALLEAALPGRKVVLERVDGHAAWVSPEALAQAGIAPDAPDPAGGRIERDARGALTGVLVDAAQDLVLGRIPPPGGRELLRLLRRGLDDLASRGLTEVHDAGCTSSVLRAYASLAREGALPVRVYAMIDGGQPAGSVEAELARWGAEPEVGFLTVRAVKLFADGALGSRGAALLQPYADAPSLRGLFVTPPDELRARLLRLLRAGFQPAVHAIGDAACHEVLRLLADLADRGLGRLRPRIEHLQLVQPADWALLRRSGAVASMQPAHLLSDAAWLERRLGISSPALVGAYAWRTARACAAALALGSDFPVEPPDPRRGLWAAEARRPDGAQAPWRGEEALTRREALEGFTRGAAWAAFAEGRRGMLREGMDADLTLFGEDVMAVAPERLRTIPVAGAVVAGRVAGEDARS